jgi:predicted dehydrogenase
MTAVLSRRQVDFPIVYSGLAEALSGHHPDYIVVANPTSQHHDMLAAVAAAGFSGCMLVEKPLFAYSQALPTTAFQRLAVAYNLRFHPVLQSFRDFLAGETVLSVHAYVGQYLPDWRPGTDYRQSYSASAVQGGGSLRDLSHEFDYIAWLFGEWQAVTALGGHVSSLEIESDDLFVLLMQTSRCPVVSVQVSYLDRVARRRIVVNTENHTIEADLVGGTLAIDGVIEAFSVERDHTYREMHQAMLNHDLTGTLCNAEEAMATMDLIAAAERANIAKEWVIR